MIGGSKNTADSGGTINTGTARDIIYGYTPEQHEAALERRLAELERLLRETHSVERKLLKQEILRTQQRLGDLEADFELTKKELAEARTLLERYGNQLESEKVEAAGRALGRGDTKLADALFAEAQEKLTAQATDMAAEAANLAFKRGKIAEEDIRWHDADTHYGEAARLAPTYESLGNAGLFALYCGAYSRAERLQIQLVELAETNFGPDDERTATALNNLAESYRAQGRYAEAEPHFRRALEVSGKALGPDHPDTANSLHNLAGLLEDTGRPDEADPLYQRAITILRIVLGDDHPTTKKVTENYEIFKANRDTP